MSNSHQIASTLCRDTFLHPLSFPSAPEKDLSHFLDPERDVPIACLMPSCSEMFGVPEVAVLEKEMADASTDGVHKTKQTVNSEIERPDSGDTKGVNTVKYQESNAADRDKVRSRTLCTKESRPGTLQEHSVSIKGGAAVTLQGPSVSIKGTGVQEPSAIIKGGGAGTLNQTSAEGGGHLQETSATGTNKAGTSKLQFSAKDKWLRHLFLVHKMVIDKANEISSLKSYSLYWKRRFSESPITDFAAVIRTNSTNDARYDPSADYFLLSGTLPEDKQFREQLQRQKLEAVLSVQQKEREEESFSRSCLFCSHVVTGNRSLLFQHMLDTHGFNVGQPDNLVFVNEFLDLLQGKLNNFQCLYCEKSFRDYPTLKDHMRKKQHKKISPTNHSYDKFYIINYLEFGKTWTEVQAEDDREILPQIQDSEWDDWRESEEISLIFCLFCPHSSKDLTSTLDHMMAEHGFDYQQCCHQHNLDYYGQIKVINYIRRKVHVNTCSYCCEQFQSHDEMSCHMRRHKHFMLPPDRSTWDQSQYFFPTFENDTFLFYLEDIS